MKRKTFILISLKYSPGLAKELLVFYENLNKYGDKTILILSKHYNEFFGDNQSFKYLSNGIGIKGMLVDFLINIFSIFKILRSYHTGENEIIFYNPHPANLLIQKYFRKKSKISLIVHEPPKTSQELMKHKFSLRFYIRIVMLFQFISMKLTDRIYLVSPSSFINFRWKDIFKNKVIKQTNLIYKVSGLPSSQSSKMYFSFIGHIFKGKGFEDFIELVNYALSNKHIDSKFCVISSSTINDHLKKLNPGYENILHVINKSNITDEEINEIINKSYGVLLLHTVGAQSGILPLCLRNGTPLICRDIKTFNQYINNNENGILLREDFTPKEIYEACVSLKEDNLYKLITSNGLKTFDKHFSEKRFYEFYKDIIE